LRAYKTKVAKAGRRAPETAMKTYIPAELVKALKISHGDTLEWTLRGKRLTVRVRKPSTPSLLGIATNLRQGKV
jgi:bifunctional DNA-binding transcriptional regulator/antitoxin component of YhaV-PrlF toxin-antitoxin module